MSTAVFQSVEGNPRPEPVHFDEQVATIANSEPVTREELIAKMDRLQHSKKHPWRDVPVFGIVRIINLSWSPERAGDVPESLSDGLGMELSAQFAMIYNVSDLARRKRRWACVTTRGTIIYLSGIRPEDRPANPGAFPPIVQSGLTQHEADSVMEAENRPRFELSRVPRQWSIAVRRADCCEDRIMSVVASEVA